MDPRTLLADIGNLDHVGIQTLILHTAAKGRFVQTRRTCRDDDSIQPVFLNRLGDQSLPWIRAHILIIGSKRDPWKLGCLLGNAFNVYCAGNIPATVTDKYSYPSHISSLTFYAVYYENVIPLC